MTTLPAHALPLLLDVPEQSVEVHREDRFTVLAPPGRNPAPAVVLVHGAYSVDRPVRPRDWAVYAGYARLLAGHGLVSVVADLAALTWPLAEGTVPSARAELDAILAAARDLPGVDPDRLGLLVFSGGALVVPPLLAPPPPWLRCAALCYPLLFEPGEQSVRPYDELAPGLPLLVTRVGREDPAWLAEVDAFLAGPGGRGTSVVEVPHGRHGFDALDDLDESRAAILATAGWLAGSLAGRPGVGAPACP